MQSHNAILADGDHVFRHARVNQGSGVNVRHGGEHQRVSGIRYLERHRVNRELIFTGNNVLDYMKELT